jgi:hypothetical protein
MEVKNFGKLNCNIWPGAEGSFVKTIDGGYALGGGATSSFNAKVLLVKFNNNGDTLWTKEFGDNIAGSFYTARQCKQTKDSGFVIIGEKKNGSNSQDVLLIKTDSLGNQQWLKTYGGVCNDGGWSVAVTPDNGFLIGGGTYIPGYKVNALVIKTDSMGNVQWQKDFGGVHNDTRATVNVASDGHLFVAFAYAFSEPYPDVPLAKLNIIKLDISGNIIWDKRWGLLDIYYKCMGFMNYLIEILLQQGIIHLLPEPVQVQFLC